MRTSRLLLVFLTASGATALADRPKSSLEVASSAFTANEQIPAEYTCEGARKSPPLSWTGVPSETKSVAILVDDPDASPHGFTHWIVTDLDPNTTSLAAGKSGYKAPCPPSGMHHYRFHVYALDQKIAPTSDRATFLKEIQGHVVADGQLVGTYEKTGKIRSRSY
ncbi:MAG TPA: YbhB/YbcL family Raf kinase inhibitor-like protein [Kofleriaceae bacterium]|jgi:hypothetical protein